jgi:hypothetical protein
MNQWLRDEQWFQRLVENVGRYRAEALRNWTLELIIQLNTISNNVSRVVDFWLNSILGVTLQILQYIVPNIIVS